MPEVLQPQFDRQCHRLAGLGVLYDLNVLDQPPATILENLTLAWHTSQPLVIREFHALTATIIDIGEADHMGSHYASRIEPTEYFLRIHAGDRSEERRAGKVAQYG